VRYSYPPLFGSLITRICENIYIGHGLKNSTAANYAPPAMPLIENEYDAADPKAEINDPSVTKAQVAVVDGELATAEGPLYDDEEDSIDGDSNEDQDDEVGDGIESESENQ